MERREYQGPVREGDDEAHFRRTGKTRKKKEWQKPSSLGKVAKAFERKKKAKKVLAKSKVEVRMPNKPPREYVPIYMKEVLKEDKRNFFLK